MKFEPIENYALIGNGQGCALISNTASIDWLVLERFDAAPTCWKLLDEKGAALSVKLHGKEHLSWKRQYLADTNVLVHEVTASNGSIRITDWMPVDLQALIRKIEVSGEMDVELEVLQYKTPWPESEKKYKTYDGTSKIKENEETNFKRSLREGEDYYLVLSENTLNDLNASTLEKLLHETKGHWEEWIGASHYQGLNEELIKRSALTLKMLIYSPTGAIMAAPTTSLPEKITGERNWDYRYCWLRDATFTLYALGYLGYNKEADSFGAYMKSAISQNPQPLQILYALDGSGETKERSVPGISGYKNSFPVRVGNDAFKQRQLDAFGDFMDWAYLHQTLGRKIDPVILDKIRETADWVRNVWNQRDRCIWEIRGEMQQFTYSKVMCWIALDRAGLLLNAQDEYEDTKREIENFIKTRCMHKSSRLKRSAQSDDVDASLLLIKLMGFPLEEEVYAKTVDEISRQLKRGPFVKRYLSQDGLPEGEGSFIICSFWLVNAYLALGREEEAKDLFQQLLNFFNEVGLLSEEIDPKTGEFLGNFPQALSHLAFIETASYFELYRKEGKKGLEGCHADRMVRLRQIKSKIDDQSS